MKQAGDIATVTSWYSVNLNLVKITGVYLSLQTQAGWFPRRGGEPEHICTGPARDLHNHAKPFYSSILSNIANCCGRYKPIWTVSCNSHNISHSPCCKLAQVVALSSPPFNVKLSVRLPSSCNAAPLIAKPQHNWKDWPTVSTLHSSMHCAVVVWADWMVERTFSEGVSTFSRVLKFYTYPLLLQLPQRKSCFIYGRTMWNWLINSETLDTSWSDERFLPVNQ